MFMSEKVIDYEMHPFVPKAWRIGAPNCGFNITFIPNVKISFRLYLACKPRDFCVF